MTVGSVPATELPDEGDVLDAEDFLDEDELGAPSSSGDPASWTTDAEPHRSTTDEPASYGVEGEPLQKLLDARARVDATAVAYETATTRWHTAQDAAADAEGAVRVAEARVDDFASAPDKLPWQQVAAAEALAKAERGAARARAAVPVRRTAVDVAQDACDAALVELQAAQAAAKAAAARAAAHPEADNAPQFTRLDDWVEQYLVKLYVREVVSPKARAWCPQWWKHAEVRARLEALWAAWEQLRLEPGTGPSVWLRDHADHHMSVIFDPEGPLLGCSATKGHRANLLPALPVEEPDRELFDVAGAGDNVDADHDRLPADTSTSAG